MSSINPEPHAIGLAFVEDHAEERARLIKLIKNSPGLELVAACASAEEALAIIPPLRPEVIILDIQLPGLSGIDCAARLAATLPSAQIMMLTVIEDHERLFQALAAGASGYLLKKTPGTKILEAIRELHQGGAPMSGQIARQVVAFFQPRKTEYSEAVRLSPTEDTILRCLAQGLLYKEIGQRLGVQMSTVRTHIWHIYRKLHARNRTEAVRKAFPNGLPP